MAQKNVPQPEVWTAQFRAPLCSFIRPRPCVVKQPFRYRISYEAFREHPQNDSATQSDGTGTDVAVGGTLCTVGDGAAQYAFTDTFDGRRLGAMTSYGSWSAVVYHYWYAFLARRLPPSAYVQKAALDCFVMTPGFEIPALMTWTGILGRGQTLDEALVQLRRDFPTALAVDVAMWGPASIVMFRYVPLRFQVPYMYGFGACWDFIMSWIAFDK